jgi:multidrug efflux system membrane fusion protein
LSFRNLRSTALLKAALVSAPILAGAALLALHGRSEANLPKAAAPLPQVTVAEVIHKPLREWQEFSGRLQAVNTVEVRPRVNGFVDRVTFADGARVRKGDLLFQIDPRPFQDEVDRLSAERARAAAEHQLARANHARAEGLIGAHAISREEYERLAAAETSAQGALDSVSSSLAAARLNREWTEVRAPIDGHVSRALITAGNLVTSANVLTTVVSDDPVYAYFDADEGTYLRYRQLNDDRRATAGAKPAAAGVYMGLVDEEGYPHAGTLDFIDNRVDPATGTNRARAVFANPDGRFTPGLFTRIRLVGGSEAETVLIEERAIGTDLGRNFVLTLGTGNRVEQRFVELGPDVDGLRVIRQGSAPAMPSWSTACSGCARARRSLPRACRWMPIAWACARSARRRPRPMQRRPPRSPKRPVRSSSHAPAEPSTP